MSEENSAKATEATETKKKPARKPHPKKERVEAEPATDVRRSSRKPQPVEKLTYAVESGEVKSAEYVKGKGAQLGDIENVEHNLNKTKAKEQVLKKLHRLIYPGASVKELVLKKNIRMFSGFADTSATHTKKVVEKLKSYDINTLRSLADILDVERGGNKEELAERVAEFLNKPVTSGRKRSASGKGKRSGSGKRKVKSKTKTKTGRVSGYILFTMEQRAEVSKENPDAKLPEVSKILGAKWKELTEEERIKYNDRAREQSAKAGSGKGQGKKRKASSKKGAKAKKQKKTSDTADDAEAEEAAGDEENEEHEEEEEEEEEENGDEEAEENDEEAEEKNAESSE